VHYSGHGTRLPAETGEDDDTGYDECIVPSDMNLITGSLLLDPFFCFVLFWFLLRGYDHCFSSFGHVWGRLLFSVSTAFDVKINK